MDNKENSEYPELDKIAVDLSALVAMEINTRVRFVESKMPYKGQYVLEELIKHLEAKV